MPLLVSCTVVLIIRRSNCVMQRLVWPPTECDDTRLCITQFDLLMMSKTVLETCRGIYLVTYLLHGAESFLSS